MVGKIKYFVRATVRPGARPHATGCGLPTDRPIMLAVCEMRKTEDVGFKIPASWRSSSVGMSVLQSMRAAGVWSDGAQAFVSAVNDSNCVLRCRRATFRFDNILPVYPVNVSCVGTALPPDQKHCTAGGVVPVVAVDPKRHPVLETGLQTKPDKLSARVKASLKSMSDHVFFTNCYNQGGTHGALYL